MERWRKIQEAYRHVGRHAVHYDRVMLHEGWLGRLCMRWLWGLDREEYPRFLEQAFRGIPKGFSGRLLEVPVGTGVISLPVYRGMPGAEVVCLDFSDAMLEAAREHARKLGLEHVSFRQGDVGALPFSDGSFDLVLSIDGFHAFPDKPGAYRETWRILREGGTFCGCMYAKGLAWRTDAFVRSFCQPMGFFTPPYETLESLEQRLSGMYRQVRLSHVGPFAGFVCKK